MHAKTDGETVDVAEELAKEATAAADREELGTVMSVYGNASDIEKTSFLLHGPNMEVLQKWGPGDPRLGLRALARHAGKFNGQRCGDVA
eukprot:131297-Pyramimonas_sp.AAC.1